VPGERLGDRRPLGAERGQRPDRATELEGEAPVADRRESRRRVIEPAEPARRAQAEGDRQRLLEQGPPRREVRSVAVGELGRRVAGGVEVGQQRLERALRNEHRRRVDDVLAGRAAVEDSARLAREVRP
jgi:hypothetical protein